MGEKEYIYCWKSRGPTFGGQAMADSTFVFTTNFLNPKSKESWSGTRKSRAFVAFNSLLRMQMQSTWDRIDEDDSIHFIKFLALLFSAFKLINPKISIDKMCLSGLGDIEKSSFMQMVADTIDLWSPFVSFINSSIRQFAYQLDQPGDLAFAPFLMHTLTI